MNSRPPFSASRFEYERKHLYYLPHWIWPRLQEPGPVYLVGTRGTGKTTLLQALNWKERLQNEALGAELGNEPFADRIIGIYMKVPETHLGMLNSWLCHHQDLYGPILAFYLDLNWFGVLASAVANLVADGIIKRTPEDEHSLVAGILEERPELHETLKGESPWTLMDLSRAVRSLGEQLEKMAQEGETPLGVIAPYAVPQVGEFGRSVAPKMMEFCDGTSPGGKESGWHFKVCLDEAECLLPFQQRVVNTMVRLSEWPLFFVVSYVQLPAEPTRTLTRLTLQRADRQLIILDEMKDVEFKEVAQGVATVQARNYLKDETVSLDIDRILGKLDINALLEKILSRSENLQARKKWLQKAQELQQRDWFTGDTREGDAPLIYQAYIVERLRLELPEPSESRWARRAQESRKIRKRMVAAYLSMCRELRTDVRYAFAEMVLQMSDKCIRDFLLQIHAIYIEANCPLTEFLGREISIDQQDAALKKASGDKMNSLRESGVGSPEETNRIIRGLAQITAVIQREGASDEHLRSSERGIFVFEFGKIDRSELEHLTQLLKDADEHGFLRLINKTKRRWKIRVHTSLAAAYQFSYRGAYYECRLAPEDIEILVKAEDEEEMRLAVRDVTRRITGQGQEMPLFRATDNEHGNA